MSVERETVMMHWRAGELAAWLLQAPRDALVYFQAEGSLRGEPVRRVKLVSSSHHKAVVLTDQPPSERGEP